MVHRGTSNSPKGPTHVNKFFSFGPRLFFIMGNYEQTCSLLIKMPEVGGSGNGRQRQIVIRIIGTSFDKISW